MNPRSSKTHPARTIENELRSRRDADELSSMTKGEGRAMVPELNPLQILQAMFDAKRYAEAMKYILETDFGPQKTQALLIRSKVVRYLVLDWMKAGRRSEAKDLIIRERNLQPTSTSLLQAETEWYRAVGRRPEAIRSINTYLQFALTIDEREQALVWRHELMLDHLKLLSESEQWRELSQFLSTDPAPGDDRYYRYQMWAARAHTEMFEFSQAESALEMASFDHSLLDEVRVAKAYIEKLKRLKGERVSLDQEEQPVVDTENTIEAQTEWVELQATWIRDSVIVKVQIGDRELPLLLDTGASLTSVDHRLKAPLGGAIIKDLGVRDFHTANGVTQGEVAQVGKVLLGPFSVSNVDISFMNGLMVHSKYMGLLGMNVLRYFDFQLDQSAGVVRLKEKK